MVAKKKTAGKAAVEPARKPDPADEEKLNRLLTPASVSLGLEGASAFASGSPEDDSADSPEYGLGERIRHLREKLGLTHDGLSELAKIADKAGRGISRTTIRGYELRTYKPGTRELRILSLALNVSPSYLIFGEEFDGQPGGASLLSGEKPGEKRRWASIGFPAICFSQLGTVERRQILDLIETLYRLQIGEVKFRSLKAFAHDFADAIQDAVSDHIERQDVSQEVMAKVFFETVEAMKKRHGNVEADLLKAVLLPVIKFWGAEPK